MLGGREAFLYLRVCLNVGKKGDSELPEEKYAWAWGSSRAALYLRHHR